MRLTVKTDTGESDCIWNWSVEEKEVRDSSSGEITGYTYAVEWDSNYTEMNLESDDSVELTFHVDGVVETYEATVTYTEGTSTIVTSPRICVKTEPN